MDSFFIFLSNYGPYLSLGIVALYFTVKVLMHGLRDMGDWKRICIFVGSLLVTMLVVVILKKLTGQARPYTAGVVTNPLIIVEGYDSFPSQHAAFMWSQVVSMSFVNRRVWAGHCSFGWTGSLVPCCCRRALYS